MGMGRRRRVFRYRFESGPWAGVRLVLPYVAPVIQVNNGRYMLGHYRWCAAAEGYLWDALGEPVLLGG